MIVKVPSLVSLAFGACALLSSFAEAAAPESSITSIEKRGLKFPFHKEKVQGVNLGGWFVLEPWITPSIFEPYAQNHEAVDEYTLCETLGPEQAYKELKRHWDTWITRDDFFEIKSRGLNFVRIPLGYWSVIKAPGDPYVQGAYKVLGKALDWAHAAGLNVMIDLHGAPLSQNGFDNSGHAGAIDWQKGGSVGLTVKVLNKIRKDYGNHPAVAAIELVNEPFGPSLDVSKLKKFYIAMNKRLRGHKLAITFHDAFLGVNSWNDFGNKLGSWLLDTHHYEMFTSPDLEMNITQHVSTACNFGGAMSTNNKITISGEWTAAMTDCAKWLNGLGYGARYDGTFSKDGQTSYYIGSCRGLTKGTVHGLSSKFKANMRRFIEAQMDAFEFAGGWIWWCWKTESAPEWDFQALAKAGVMPQPLSARKYGNQCG